MVSKPQDAHRSSRRDNLINFLLRQTNEISIMDYNPQNLQALGILSVLKGKYFDKKLSK
jgi:hypothetical protein